MNILEKIIAHKEIEVAKRKVEVPVGLLEQRPFFQRKTLSLQQSLLDRSKTGIIAEFKRRSPSKGNINEGANVEEVTRTYMQAGAAGISVLTDTEFFGALKGDFEVARQLNIPILRKDFMIDEYQVTEAKAMGADVILLIAACLTPARVKQLANFARSLDLEVLLELHGEDEMDHICDEISMVGINNRDLKTFTVDISRSIAMAGQLKDQKILIAESGINDIETIILLQQNGFSGFLIGEHFMKQPDPTIAFVQFVQQLKQKQHAN